MKRRNFLVLLGGSIAAFWLGGYYVKKSIDEGKEKTRLEELRKREKLMEELRKDTERLKRIEMAETWRFFYEKFLRAYVPNSYKLNLKMKKTADNKLDYIKCHIFPFFQRGMEPYTAFHINSDESLPHPDFSLFYKKQKLIEKGNSWFFEIEHGGKKLAVRNISKNLMDKYVDFILKPEGGSILDDSNFNFVFEYAKSKSKAPNYLEINIDDEFRPFLENFVHEPVIEILSSSDENAYVMAFCHNPSNPYPGWDYLMKDYKNKFEKLVAYPYEAKEHDIYKHKILLFAGKMKR